MATLQTLAEESPTNTGFSRVGLMRAPLRLSRVAPHVSFAARVPHWLKTTPTCTLRVGAFLTGAVLRRRLFCL